jgi:hypothetical protein
MEWNDGAIYTRIFVPKLSSCPNTTVLIPDPATWRSGMPVGGKERRFQQGPHTET